MGALEVKQKLGQTSLKKRYPLTRQVDLSCGETWRTIIRRIESELSPPVKSEIGNAWFPVLFNSYRREYYVSLDGRIRITLDMAQMVFDQLYSAYPNLTRPSPQPDTVVIEIKGAPEEWNGVKDVAQEFPISVSRNSKYAVGCQAILYI